MVGNKKQKEQVGHPPARTEDFENERQPGWIQKYLDLADLLMRRRKHKDNDDRPKAA